MCFYFQTKNLHINVIRSASIDIQLKNIEDFCKHKPSPIVWKEWLMWNGSTLLLSVWWRLSLWRRRWGGGLAEECLDRGPEGLGSTQFLNAMRGSRSFWSTINWNLRQFDGRFLMFRDACLELKNIEEAIVTKNLMRPCGLRECCY